MTLHVILDVKHLAHRSWIKKLKECQLLLLSVVLNFHYAHITSHKQNYQIEKFQKKLFFIYLISWFLFVWLLCSLVSYLPRENWVTIFVSRGQTVWSRGTSPSSWTGSVTLGMRNLSANHSTFQNQVAIKSCRENTDHATNKYRL